MRNDAVKIGQGTVDKESHILIVDDREENVLLLESILIQAGYRNFASLTDPTLVEAHYLEHGFDLLLLDIRMPKMSGFEVLRRLDEISGDDYLPVLVLTAQTDVETKIKALELGAKDFVTKPFLKQEVQLRIANMLKIRNAYNQERRLNQILETRVIERTAEVVDTQFEIIRRLARAGEYRDNETGMHVIRVGKSTQLLARSLGYSDEFSELVMHASTMHDVGKIGVPREVLMKPGELDEGEWKLVRSHTTIGGQILAGSPSPVIKMGERIALSHHERWDGGGYPNGLAGGKIPLEGRICGVADFFDSLTIDRPQRTALGNDEVVDMLREASGTQFDPDVVDAFMRSFEAIEKIQREVR